MRDIAQKPALKQENTIKLDLYDNFRTIDTENTMAFKEAKSKVIECLNNGHVLHEERNDIDIKNLLSTGIISISEITTIIGRSRGNEYSSSTHHYDAKIDIHIIKTTHSGKNWYIKWYFTDPDSVFISVHE